MVTFRTCIIFGISLSPRCSLLNTYQHSELDYDTYTKKKIFSCLGWFLWSGNTHLSTIYLEKHAYSDHSLYVLTELLTLYILLMWLKYSLASQHSLASNSYFGKHPRTFRVRYYSKQINILTSGKDGLL